MELDLAPVDPPRTTEVGHRILAAASVLFAARGLGATGVDLIVDRAGTTKRTLYQRFGSKDALVAAYLRQRAHTWQTHLLGGLAGTGERALASLYGLAREWVADNPRGCAFVNAWAELGPHDHPAVAVIREEKAWMRRLFTWIADGDAATAEALHLLYEGAQVTASIHQSTAPFGSALAASRRLLGTP